MEKTSKIQHKSAEIWFIVCRFAWIFGDSAVLCVCAVVFVG